MSSLRSTEIDIPVRKPFENCKLGRKKYAEVLTQIIENYSDGFVLSVNNKWGEGKTTFIKMWKVHLGNRGFKNIYFNAWEHDFGQDPMAPILSEIKSLNIGSKTDIKELIKLAGKFSINAIPIILKAIAEKHIDTGTITDGLKDLSQKAIEAFQEEVNDYEKKKTSLEAFKSLLEDHVKNLDKPLVFIIDELDRCNPKYAVEVLEIIKHFFSVPGIIFVLSIDKEQLGNAVRGYYGSDRIDADEYLRRFIDLEYSIPRPQIKPLVEWMFEKYIQDSAPKRFSQEEFMTFKKITTEYLKDTNFSVRLIDKFFIQIKLALSSIKEREAVFSELLIILLLIKSVQNDLYQKIKNKTMSSKDFIKEIQRFISFNEHVGEDFKLELIEVKFAFLYSNNFERQYNKDIITHLQGSEYKLLYEPKFDESEKFVYSVRKLNEYQRNYMNQYSLDYLISKIELLDPIQ